MPNEPSLRTLVAGEQAAIAQAEAISTSVKVLLRIYQAVDYEQARQFAKRSKGGRVTDMGPNTKPKRVQHGSCFPRGFASSASSSIVSFSFQTAVSRWRAAVSGSCRVSLTTATPVHGPWAMQVEAGCQVCETLTRPLTCATCLRQSKHLGNDWATLEQLRNTRDAARSRLETALSLQVRLEPHRIRSWS